MTSSPYTIKGPGGTEFHMSERSYDLVREGAALNEEQTIEVRTREIRAGDFLDQINPARMVGPRGGRYRYDGVRVGSRVVRAGLNDRGQFVITPSTGPAFAMPGNAQDCTTAIVRRKSQTDVRGLTDDELLAHCESSDRAVVLAAEAELERRTR